MTAALGRDHRAPSRPQLWHITERATFATLRRSPHRARRGPVSITWLPAVHAGDQPRVAYAIGRSTGNAVARNRIRRRLRAALQQLQARDRLPGGTYLVGGRSELMTLPWAELVAAVDIAVASATVEAQS